MEKKIGVAIVGASGYAARELAGILLRHPEIEITAATTRQDETPRLEALHPSLLGRISLGCTAFDAARIADCASFAFLALPHTASMAVVPSLKERGVRVIDLSADYRLTDPQVYADWYGHVHTDPQGLQAAVYGLPELFRSEIPPADLIANPGCYTSASILALAPLSPKTSSNAPESSSTPRVACRARRTRQADLSLSRVQRESRRLRSRAAPPHARNRPGAHAVDGWPGRSRRSHFHASSGADGPRNLRDDIRPAESNRHRARLVGALSLVLRRQPIRARDRSPARHQGLGVYQFLRPHRPRRAAARSSSSRASTI